MLSKVLRLNPCVLGQVSHLVAALTSELFLLRQFDASTSTR